MLEGGPNRGANSDRGLAWAERGGRRDLLSGRVSEVAAIRWVSWPRPQEESRLAPGIQVERSYTNTMAYSPLQLSIVEPSAESPDESSSASPARPVSKLLHGLDSQNSVPLPAWVATHVTAQNWQGARLSIEGLKQAAAELEARLSTMDRQNLMHWFGLENEFAMDVDPTLVFLMLARDLRALEISGDLEIGGL